MMFVHAKLIFFCAIVLTALTATFGASVDQKIGRVNRQLQLNPFIDYKQSPNTKDSKSASKSSQPLSVSTVGSVTTKFVKAVKDEVVDCFDALVFAKTHAERFDNALDILNRHKAIIGVGAMAAIAKESILSPRAQKLGADLISELRNNEVQKWGSRAFR